MDLSDRLVEEALEQPIPGGISNADLNAVYPTDELDLMVLEATQPTVDPSNLIPDDILQQDAIPIMDPFIDETTVTEVQAHKGLGKLSIWVVIVCTAVVLCIFIY